MKKILNKIKQHKGKIGAGILASVIGANVLEFNPKFVDKVTEAKVRLVGGGAKKALKVKEELAKILPVEKENVIESKVTPEDLTASEYVGITVYIEGERKRLTLSIDQRDKLLGIFGDVEYIKKEGGGRQVDVLLLLDCQDRFGEKEELYNRCVDLVFEDSQSEEE